MKNRIRDIRKAYSLSMTKFGERLGVSKDVIANLEYGRVEPSEMIKKLICIEFSVDPNWLETGEGEKPRRVGNLDVIIDELVGEDNETARAVFKALARRGKQEWEALGRLIRDIARELED